MKYMIMTFGPSDGAVFTESQSTDWIKKMIKFMRDLDDELRDTGELLDNRGLAWPNQAKTVRFIDGAPVATDGPFAEAKEGLVGYWVVDVVDEQRAIDIASKIVAFVHNPIEVRAIPDGPPPEFL
jgi:hypothetical protein